jgi:hypothetical protein
VFSNVEKKSFVSIHKDSFTVTAEPLEKVVRRFLSAAFLALPANHTDIDACYPCVR